MTEFNDYDNLFAEKGDFDIPPSMTTGFALKPTRDLTFVFDFQKIWYSKVDSVANPIANIFDCPAAGGTDPESCLDGSNGAGFGWKDMEVYRFGVQYPISPSLELRAGASFAEHPIDRSEVLFNILAPAVAENHCTLGLTKKLPGDREVSAAFMCSPRERQKGPNPFDPTQTIEIEIYQFDLEISFSQRF